MPIIWQKETKKGAAKRTPQLSTYRARRLRSRVAPQRCPLSSAGGKVTKLTLEVQAVEHFFCDEQWI